VWAQLALNEAPHGVAKLLVLLGKGRDRPARAGVGGAQAGERLLGGGGDARKG
jgi:hypothetical protein